jgi:hypothetical protein
MTKIKLKIEKLQMRQSEIDNNISTFLDFLNKEKSSKHNFSTMLQDKTEEKTKIEEEEKTMLINMKNIKNI